MPNISGNTQAKTVHLVTQGSPQEPVEISRRAGSMLKDSSEHASIVFQNSGNGIMLTDAEHTIIQVNPAFCRISGFAENEIIGKKPFILRSGEHDEIFYNHIWKVLELEGLWQGEICHRHRNGDLFYVWETISAVVNEQGEVSHYINNLADITEIKQQQKRLDDLANYDSLTELPNRHYLQANLTQATEMSKRRGDKVALLFIDLDKFKPINDDYGHKAGDNALAEIAHRLQNCVRTEDTAARIGGDEFVILMPKIKNRSVIDAILNRIQKSLSAPIEVKPGTEVTIQASIGISIFPDDLKNKEGSAVPFSENAEILELADQAMYEAKEKRVPFCYFEQLTKNTNQG